LHAFGHDTSPLNYLVLIGHVESLPHFHQRVLVPSFVWQELQDLYTPDQVRVWNARPPACLELQQLKNPPDSSLNFLDRGEREAIAIGRQHNVVSGGG
jgi:predicted nucleic acid-binding protein